MTKVEERACEQAHALIGQTVRLKRTLRGRDGRPYRKGRAFRVLAVMVRGDTLILSAPGGGPRLVQDVSPAHVRRVLAGGEPGYCRVCGCTQDHGCELDRAGRSCHWANAEHTLCSRCRKAAVPGLDSLKALRRSLDANFANLGDDPDDGLGEFAGEVDRG